MILRGAPLHARPLSLNFYLKLVTLMASFRKTICWVSVGIGALACRGILTSGGYVNNFDHSSKNRHSSDMIDDITKSKGSWPLLNSYIGDTTNGVVEFSGFNEFSPPEWNALTTETKVTLSKMLTWENLSKWEFNIFEVAELTSDPLLFVGWAILCEPLAQAAMKRSLGVVSDADDGFDAFAGSDDVNSYHYHFYEHFKIDPRTICNFLREIERRYQHDNPYHNNVHAADIVQTTHCLFQLMDAQYLSRLADPIIVFSMILAASFHDVSHPGTNNLFEQNTKTPLAIKYNNESILEKMHISVGLSLLSGEGKQDEWDIFEGWMHDDKVRAQEIMTLSILKTDMSHHFEVVDDLKSLIEQVHVLAKEVSEENAKYAEIGGDEPQPILSILAVTHELKSGEGGDSAPSRLEGECRRLANFIIRFIMHCADISSAAKTTDLSLYWGKCVLDEFFEQGDKEKDMGLPISPLCDRETVKKPESQIDFINFIVQPTYEVLGDIIPRVKEEVAPLIVDTLEYWEQEKLKLSTGSEEGEITHPCYLKSKLGQSRD